MKSSRESGDFISTVFTRKKKSGTFRFILNSKYLNNFVVYKHFKMESILDVFKIINKDVWMASVDLKDAFLTIPINEAYQKYFMFGWLEKFINLMLYQMDFQMQCVFLQKYLNQHMHI